MKIIRTNNSIISLENVRRVELHESTTNHTSMGKKYSIDHYSIGITYCDDKHQSITCGEDAKGQDTANRLLDKIFEILSKEG